MNEWQIIVLIVYVIGIVPGYLCFKQAMIKDGTEWSKSFQRVAVFLSLASWIIFLVAALVKWIESGEGKKATW